MHSESERGVEVTQADREAAALLYDRISWQSWSSINHPHSQAAQRMIDGIADENVCVQAFARHRATNPTTGWRSIDSAPAAVGPDDRKVLVVGGIFNEPRLVLPDGDWWRQRKREGARSFDWWMYPPELPPPPTTPPAGGEHVE